MWRFPRGFEPGRTAGISQRSTYLRVIGDFCRWGDEVVFGSDDTARAEFLNKRRHKGNIVGPGQSQSNLWFVEPGRIDRLGVPLGRGAVWQEEAVTAGTPSDAFLFDGGFERRLLHLAHGADHDVAFTVELDRRGDGRWRRVREYRVPAGGYRWIPIPRGLRGAWVRLRTDRDAPGVTAAFAMSDTDRRPDRPSAIFDGLAGSGDTAVTGGLVRARGADLRTLALVADRPGAGGPQSVGYYELDGDLELVRVEDPASDRWHRDNVPIPTGVMEVDDASVLIVDDHWQLGRPRGRGGPWAATAVAAGAPSDPYLMTGYEDKRIALSHDGDEPVDIAVEVDITGDGTWVTYDTFHVRPGSVARHRFMSEFAAYWMRCVAAAECTATVQLTYGSAREAVRPT